MNTWTRKQFLKASLVGGSAALIARGQTAPAIARTRSANDEVRVAIVGLTGKGTHHIRDFPKVPGVRIAAFCDCDSQILAKRAADFEKEHYKVTTYVDYRKLLESPDVDAVVIVTPNHWHALMTIWACQAGKDVYVEKPVSHNIWEGRKEIEAAAKYRRIVQAGTQSRSARELQEAHAYIKGGNLGKILWARGLCYKLRESLGKSTGPQPVPAHIDYDLWSGPAPLVPPRRNTPRWGTVHYDWHWFWNYGGGDIANQGIHQMDICRWFLDEPGLPPTVMSMGGRFGYDDDAETPNTQVAFFGYQKAPLIFEVRGLPAKPGMRVMDAYRSVRGVGVVVQCEHGYFAPGETGGGAAYDNDDKRIQQFSGSGGGDHPQNFISAVRSRNASSLAAPLEGGHISTSLCHLANISYRLGHEKSNDAIKDDVASNQHTRDAFDRMLEHLKVHNVDVASTPTVIGPTLHVALGSERLVTKEKYDTGYWANTMLGREYRHPYVVSDKV